MGNLPQNVIKHKVGLLNLAAELGNVPHLQGWAPTTASPHQCKMCCGRTPRQTLVDRKEA